MALQSIHDLWVDANFKETQLADLRIGQRVDLYADMYGGRKKFQGHISGFTMGTGSTIALLPPENATGNFVKVVQRLPVRIELDNYDPGQAPAVHRPFRYALRRMSRRSRRGSMPANSFSLICRRLPQAKRRRGDKFCLLHTCIATSPANSFAALMASAVALRVAASTCSGPCIVPWM